MRALAGVHCGYVTVLGTVVAMSFKLTAVEVSAAAAFIGVANIGLTLHNNRRSEERRYRREQLRPLILDFLISVDAYQSLADGVGGYMNIGERTEALRVFNYDPLAIFDPVSRHSKTMEVLASKRLWSAADDLRTEIGKYLDSTMLDGLTPGEISRAFRGGQKAVAEARKAFVEAARSELGSGRKSLR